MNLNIFLWHRKIEAHRKSFSYSSFSSLLPSFPCIQKHNRQTWGLLSPPKMTKVTRVFSDWYKAILTFPFPFPLASNLSLWVPPYLDESVSLSRAALFVIF